MFELNQLVLSLNGEIYDCEMINLISTKSIKIHCENKPDWTLDGEFEPGVEDIEIKNSEKAFRIFLKK
jgi:diacylglycerol kinase family enzyme